MDQTQGAGQWTYSYDAWGNPTATPTTGAPDNPIQYTGGYNDPTGLTHLGAREYDPTTGRFLQADPANLATGSTYAYTDDQPTFDTDTDGLGAQGTFGIAVGALGWGDAITGLDILSLAGAGTTAGFGLAGAAGYGLAWLITPGGQDANSGPSQYTDSQGPTVTTPAPGANVVSAKGHARGENRAIRDAANSNGLNPEGRRVLGREVEKEKKAQGIPSNDRLPYNEIDQIAKGLAENPRYGKQ